MLEDSSLGQRRALQEKEQLEAELCKAHQIVRVSRTEFQQSSNVHDK